LSQISPEAARRRKLLTRAVPIAVLAAGALAAGLILGSGSEIKAAERFAEAWAEGDYETMHDELSPESAAEYPLEKLEAAYEEAARTATTARIVAGEAREGGEGAIVPITAETRAFGDVGGDIEIGLEDGLVAWSPALVFPGLRAGEELDRRTRAPPRGAILAKGGVPLAEGPASRRSSPLGAAATAVTGTVGPPEGEAKAEVEARGFPASSAVGTTGLELAFDRTLAGTPGGELLAVPADDGGGSERVLATSKPAKGKPVRTTLDPNLQRAAVTALGDLFGGVAVLDADDGHVRALAGIAFSSPQPPGSTMKVITTVGALEEGIVKLDDTFPVESSNTDIGRTIENASDELCGGTFVESFAHSCNTVFAPLGAELGGEKLVSTSEAFGFNSPPQLYNEEATAAIDPPASTIPTDISSDVDVGVSAIGQGEVLATPLQLASVAQTIANGGTRSPTAITNDPDYAPDAKPVEVTSKEIASTVRDLMVEVVENGTGEPADISEAQIAAKTGTAELGPKPGAEAAEGEDPPQELDAWFTAFAPAASPELVVAVMVVHADGGGGDVAGPIAAEVFQAGL
jgi:cell division protein FtsI/penicillin-binding protein 2